MEVRDEGGVDSAPSLDEEEPVWTAALWTLMSPHGKTCTLLAPLPAVDSERRMSSKWKVGGCCALLLLASSLVPPTTTSPSPSRVLDVFVGGALAFPSFAFFLRLPRTFLDFTVALERREHLDPSVQYTYMLDGPSGRR